VKHILVLGGYGGFGARLSRRLVDAGYGVIVAGRNLDTAQQFCTSLNNAEPLKADRNGDMASILEAYRPDLVIDAAGPFQNSSYALPYACIDAQIPYIDLADARDFVLDIVSLNTKAEKADVAVISGASSVPALSGAVIRRLIDGLDNVRTIDIAISASNRATAGASVSSAILSYVGKPVRLWRTGRWTKQWGWQSLRQQSIDVGHGKHLSRLVALADVPDHDIFPKTVKGGPAVTFRAGPEFALQTMVLWLCSWPIRWGLFNSLSPVANWLRHLQGLTAKLGSDRSAMVVAVKGFDKEKAIERQWTLIAENGDGPEIPTMAAALIAQMILKGRIKSGARDASDILMLDLFEPLFARLAIKLNSTEKEYIPLSKRVMGDKFDLLPEAVRSMHLICGDGSAQGSATVVRSKNPLAQLICMMMRFPKTGQHNLHVGFEERDGIEHWTRDFGGTRFTSHLSEANGYLVERFGPLRFYFDLPFNAEKLSMLMRKWSIFHIALPIFLAPRSDAHEWQDGDDFCFDVPIALPLIGMIVHYSGRLQRSTTPLEM
jgi:predicted dinucleotide-binding enzyme